MAQGISDPAKQYEAVIVASIVQAEGGQAEYGDVAGAIYNRLKPNDQTYGYLQVDSAVTYGLGTKSFNFTDEERQDKSNVYNTYANPACRRPHRLPGQDRYRRGGEAQNQRLPVLGNHQPGHKGDKVLQDARRAQRLRQPVQHLVPGQRGPLRMSLRAAVLGHPISHSKSPALHLAAYGKLGMDIGYTALDLTEQALPDFMEQVRTQQGWRGLSVTMPLKSGMFAEVDEVRGVARTLGVVNTVAFEEDHGSVRRIGYNTDVAGIVNAVMNAGVAASPAAVVLGGAVQPQPQWPR
ncbi:shikimate dehydrogenase [Arthrobacter sp. Hiyo4]|nr:shikimate dehydrogenase [Arthrobacter sp. Hiyo4]